MAVNFLLFLQASASASAAAAISTSGGVSDDTEQPAALSSSPVSVRTTLVLGSSFPFLQHSYACTVCIHAFLANQPANAIHRHLSTPYLPTHNTQAEALIRLYSVLFGLFILLGETEWGPPSLRQHLVRLFPRSRVACHVM